MKGLYGVGFLLFFTLTACDSTTSSENHKSHATISGKPLAGEQRATLLPRTALPGSPTPAKKPVESPSKPQVVEKLGIEVEPGRIVIDTRKVRAVLENLAHQLQAGVQASSSTKTSVEAPDLGIRVSDEKVEIDLNKTRSFLKKWMGVMKVLGDELDRALAPQP